jgi:hypothetical protein
VSNTAIVMGALAVIGVVGMLLVFVLVATLVRAEVGGPVRRRRKPRGRRRAERAPRRAAREPVRRVRPV